MAPTNITSVRAEAIPYFAGGGQYDLVSLAEMKDELQIANGASDSWLRSVIARASAAVSRHCNRPFQIQTYQDLVWCARDEVYANRLVEGVMPLQLERWPLSEAASTAGTAPPLPPTLSQAAGGSLVAATYYAKASYVTEQGETAASVESILTIGSGKLLQVASPAADVWGRAIGWNVYVGAPSFFETRQNAEPLAMGASWSCPPSGLIAGAALPPYPLVVENTASPATLAEGVDFIADSVTGQLTRLRPDGSPRRWPPIGLLVQYQAGFAKIPDDIAEAVMQLVKWRWFARQRDPGLRSENVTGVYEAQYWLGTGIGGAGDLPAEVADKIERYRVPVVA